MRLTPIVPMTLEQAIAYIEDDELVEVTPQNIRLRKRELLPHLRKRAKQWLTLERALALAASHVLTMPSHVSWPAENSRAECRIAVHGR